MGCRIKPNGWWLTVTRGGFSLGTPPCHFQPHSVTTQGPTPPGGCPDTPIPRPRPVEKQRKMTMRMSSPSCTQILFMMRIICSVSMSCRRSSPHCEPPGGERPEQGGERQGQAAHGFWGARCPRFGHPTEDELTLKMTRIFSPRGSTFWKESFRGTALELK